MIEVRNQDCLEGLEQIDQAAMIFCDAPDNIGAKYDVYQDRLPENDYFNWIGRLALESTGKAKTVWISMPSLYTVQVARILDNISLMRGLNKPPEIRHFIWRYTFGQYRDDDCAQGYRSLWRFRHFDAPIYADNIRVPSKRMLSGDKRAAGPRVPDDVFDFPRVVGNAKERRAWHPTQHPEALMERIIKMSTKEGDLVIDLFGGTGTTGRVCKRIGRDCILFEISENYCRHMGFCLR